MTDLLDRAVASVKELPADTQDDIARILLELIGADQEFVELTPEDIAAIEISKAEAARGDFATEDEVRAVWAKHGL